jgi:hypothetical protein
MHEKKGLAFKPFFQHFIQLAWSDPGLYCVRGIVPSGIFLD